MSSPVRNFEVAMYNKEVRELAKMNDTHPQFDEGWADQRFIPIEARDEDHARRMINLQFPPRRGFVIINIIELPDFV